MAGGTEWTWGRKAGGSGVVVSQAAGFSAKAEDHHRQIVVSSFGGRDE